MVRGRLVEVYPAAALNVWRLQYQPNVAHSWGNASVSARVDSSARRGGRSRENPGRQALDITGAAPPRQPRQRCSDRRLVAVRHGGRAADVRPAGLCVRGSWRRAILDRHPHADLHWSRRTRRTLYQHSHAILRASLMHPPRAPGSRQPICSARATMMPAGPRR